MNGGWGEGVRALLHPINTTTATGEYMLNMLICSTSDYNLSEILLSINWKVRGN